MQQYFVKEHIVLDQPIQMDDEAFHHISHVLRMKENDIIRLCDERQLCYARLHFENGAVYALPYERIEDKTKTAVPITLAMGLIKGDKWDLLIQKACELGVEQIIPFTSSRCVVKNKAEKQDKKLNRWNKIAKEACEQCKRSALVKVHAPIPFAELTKWTQPNALKLIAYEDADLEGQHLASLLAQHKKPSHVLIVIGAEGGFAKEEVELLRQHDFACVSLGGRILRAETAAFYALSVISFYYEL